MTKNFCFLNLIGANNEKQCRAELIVPTSFAPIKFQNTKFFVIINTNQQSTKSVDPQNKSCLPSTPDPLGGRRL